MSKIGIAVSIDVTKLDKSRIKEVTKKDGSVAKYLNLTTFINPTEEDQYGNHGFIAQSQTKEERESGAERPPIELAMRPPPTMAKGTANAPIYLPSLINQLLP